MRRVAIGIIGFFFAVTGAIVLAAWLVANVVGITGASSVVRLGSLALLVLVVIAFSGGGRPDSPSPRARSPRGTNRGARLQ
jgi:hypothetical protein